MITEKDILKIANLAKLEINDGELPLYINEINNMLSFADSIDVDFQEAITLRNAIDFKLLREDSIKPSLENSDIISNAPLAEDGFFKLRKRAENE